MRYPTDNERNHGGSISAGGFQALDQFLHLPDLDVLLHIVRLLLLLLGTHFEEEKVICSQGKEYRRPDDA